MRITNHLVTWPKYWTAAQTISASLVGLPVPCATSLHAASLLSRKLASPIQELCSHQQLSWIIQQGEGFTLLSPLKTTHLELQKVLSGHHLKIFSDLYVLFCMPYHTVLFRHLTIEWMRWHDLQIFFQNFRLKNKKRGKIIFHLRKEGLDIKWSLNSPFAQLPVSKLYNLRLPTSLHCP